MTIEFERSDNGHHLTIADEMTIYTAAEQKGELFSHLGESQELVVDLSGVSEIDSAGLQVLMALKQQAKSDEKGLHLTNHSQAVIEVMELLHIAPFFGDPVVIPTEWQKS